MDVLLQHDKNKYLKIQIIYQRQRKCNVNGRPIESVKTRTRGFYRKHENNNIRTNLDSPLGWHDCSTAGHDSLSSTNTVLSPEENDKIVKQK